MVLYPNNTTKQVINSEITKKITNLSEQIESVLSSITTLQSRVSTTESDISSAETDIETLTTSLETLQSTLETLSDELEDKQDSLTFDNQPTSSSNNPVKSGGIYSALENKLDKSSVSFDPTPNGTDALSTGGAYDIVQDLSSQIQEIKDLTVIQTTDDEEYVNHGTIIVENTQSDNANAIQIENGGTILQDTEVQGTLKTDTINSVTNEGITFDDTIIADEINATEYQGQLEHSLSVVDKNGSTTTFNNSADVTIDSVESAKLDINGDQIDITYVKNSELGVSVATLDSNGKIPTSQLSIEALVYCGEWDASSGTFPTVGSGDSGELISGDFYNVSVSGTIDNVDYEVNDWIIYKVISGVGSWSLKENSSDVHSVNGKTGVVTLTPSDIGITIV